MPNKYLFAIGGAADDLDVLHKDVDAIRAVLDELKQDCVDCSPAEPVTSLYPREALVNAAELVKSSKRSGLIFYFTGHGKVKDKELNLQFGVSKGGAVRDAVSFSGIVEILRGKEVLDGSVFIIDSCFSGEATKGEKYINGDLESSLKELDKENVPGTRGYAVLASSSGNAASYVDARVGLSVYTNALCASLRTLFGTNPSLDITATRLSHAVNEILAKPECQHYGQASFLALKEASGDIIVADRHVAGEPLNAPGVGESVAIIACVDIVQFSEIESSERSKSTEKLWTALRDTQPSDIQEHIVPRADGAYLIVDGPQAKSDPHLARKLTQRLAKLCTAVNGSKAASPKFDVRASLHLGRIEWMEGNSAHNIFGRDNSAGSTIPARILSGPAVHEAARLLDGVEPQGIVVSEVLHGHVRSLLPRTGGSCGTFFEKDELGPTEIYPRPERPQLVWHLKHAQMKQQPKRLRRITEIHTRVHEVLASLASGAAKVFEVAMGSENPGGILVRASLLAPVYLSGVRHLVPTTLRVMSDGELALSGEFGGTSYLLGEIPEGPVAKAFVDNEIGFVNRLPSGEDRAYLDAVVRLGISREKVQTMDRRFSTLIAVPLAPSGGTPIALLCLDSLQPAAHMECHDAETLVELIDDGRLDELVSLWSQRV